MLAEEIILIGRGEGCVAVGRSDHAQLIRVHARFLFNGKAALQCFTDIVARQHVRRLLMLHRQIAEFPTGIAEIGKFIIGG